MFDIRKIHVPFDSSPHSDAALGLACDLAKRFSAALTLVHVDHPLTYAAPEGYVMMTPAHLVELKEHFEHAIAEAKHKAIASGVPSVDSAILRGPVAPEIVRHASQRHCDLIVMGTHGRTGIKHALLGSVAEEVTRLAPCPTLTIRV